jgi:hypothetical protein
MKFLFFFLVLISYSANLLAQGEIDEQKKILLRDERTFGLSLNSNGIGGDYKYAKRINAKNHNIYQIELMSLKHPKEIKITNNIYSNKSFVFGKTNNFFVLKGVYGRQSEIYRKNDAGGISIRYNYSIGPTIGILKPIYYEVLYTTGVPWEFYSKIEKFNTSTHQSDIYGRASFFKGFNELSLVPGISTKAGFTFEYSRIDKALHSIEIGIGMDLYPKEIPIMAIENNNFFFLNLYAGYRFGKVIDISEAARAKTWREKQKDRKTSRKIVKQQKEAAKQDDKF